MDGVPAGIWRANHAFQAVEVRPGRHEVRLVYGDRSFQIGVGVSLAAWVGVVVWWRWERRRARELFPEPLMLRRAEEPGHVWRPGRVTNREGEFAGVGRVPLHNHSSEPPVLPGVLVV